VPVFVKLKAKKLQFLFVPFLVPSTRGRKSRTHDFPNRKRVINRVPMRGDGSRAQDFFGFSFAE
jgi:hypothetical protein